MIEVKNSITKVKIDEYYLARYPEYAKVHNALAECYMSKKRYRLYYGNVSNGKVWNEIMDVTGYVCLSSGSPYKRTFIIVNNKRCIGGPAISSQLIVGIQDIQNKKFVYRHENFHFPDLRVDGNRVVEISNVNTKLVVAECESEAKAQSLMEFLTGKRFNKN